MDFKVKICVILHYSYLVSTEQAITDVRACQNPLVLLGSNKNMAEVVDVVIGAKVKLDCDFCDVADNFQAKTWYFKKRGEVEEPTEISIDMENNPTQYRISLTPSHTLSVTNFTLNDSGIYTCKRFNHEEESIFTYVLEGVIKSKLLPKIGKLSEWQEYKRLKLDPINNQFEKSNKQPFSQLREHYNFTFRILTSWESWGKCEICGRRRGIRRKTGKCRLYPVPHNHTFEVHDNITGMNVSNTESLRKIINYYLFDDYHVACLSLHLNLTFPALSEIVRHVPDFMETEPCEGLCIPVVEGALTGRKKDYKYKMSKHIADNSHITLTCPEVSLESTVEWFKDKEILNSTFRNNMANTEEEPHLTIDAYNSLFILHATKNEEAVYTCTVDEEKMQKFDIRVVSKSKVLNQEFIRYSIYLGFVLSLTLTCYCAGMCVAWRRRGSFADPLNPRKLKR